MSMERSNELRVSLRWGCLLGRGLALVLAACDFLRAGETLVSGSRSFTPGVIFGDTLGALVTPFLLYVLCEGVLALGRIEADWHAMLDRERAPPAVLESSSLEEG